ncbi:MAG: hypothetical protein SNJ80_04740 [Anaerolinea sp.]
MKPSTSTPAAETKPKPSSIIPLTIHETPDALILTLPPRRLPGVLLFGFAALWNGMLWFGLLFAENSPLFTPGWALWEYAVLALFVVAGVGLMAFAAAALLNTETICITREQITFDQRPIQLWRRRSIPLRPVTGFSIHEDEGSHSLHVEPPQVFAGAVLTGFSSRRQLEEIRRQLAAFLFFPDTEDDAAYTDLSSAMRSLSQQSPIMPTEAIHQGNHDKREEETRPRQPQTPSV